MFRRKRKLKETYSKALQKHQRLLEYDEIHYSELIDTLVSLKSRDYLTEEELVVQERLLNRSIVRLEKAIANENELIKKYQDRLNNL